MTTPRIMVDIITRYCAKRAVALDIRADGWLLLLGRPPGRKLILGYDFGLNTAVAHRVASDKAATSEVLALSGVACVPHSYFMAPLLSGAPEPAWAAMLELLQAHPNGVVVKPNEGTSGRSVTHVTDRPALEAAVSAIFAVSANVALSPFLVIDDEIRVVLLDGAPLIVYRKQRRLPEWRHNLELGATPVLLDSGAVYESCVALAIAAAQAIGIRFASVDVVRGDGGWQVLEINSGVMMETLAKSYPEQVDAAYSVALDALFATSDVRPSSSETHRP